SGHWGRQATEDGLAIMTHLAGLAMHQVRRADDVTPESRPDGLMSQANAKQRYLAGKMPDQRNRDSRLLRRAGARGEKNPFRAHGFHLRRSYLVIPPHLDLGTQFTQILDQVIGKRIVVVEDENHKLNRQVLAYTKVVRRPGGRANGKASTTKDTKVTKENQKPQPCVILVSFVVMAFAG